MPRFFIENCYFCGDVFKLNAKDSLHVSRSLRMEVGNRIVVCDGKFNDYYCEIVKITKSEVFLKVLEIKKIASEPKIKVHLFQAIPKLDKLEYIIQKSVELGVYSVTPVLTKRCIAKINANSVEDKLKRLNKIAKQAAMQSGRGIVPLVNSPLKFKEYIEKTKEFEFNILFYEYGNGKMNNLKMCGLEKISLMIGCEGGFEKDEVELAEDGGIKIASLGRRILRCETASICALTIIMYITENLW